MSVVVHEGSPDPWRARVDARRTGLSSCAQSELREHRLQRRAADPRETDPVACRSPRMERPHLSYARYLERQNLQAPSATLEPRPSHRSFAAIPAQTPRLDIPRLGDVPRLERPKQETRLRVVYRIEVPLRAGRVIDVLA